MGNFFDLFPRTLYKLDGGRYSNYDTAMNITFRIGVIRNVLANHSAYYQYVVRDGETPEMLADMFYGDPGAHWMIIYSNNILDPTYDWPLDTRSFNSYIIDKYGSVEASMLGIHHYEKVITRENVTDNIITVNRYRINGGNVAMVMPTELDRVPYDTYESLEFAPDPIDLSVGGKTVTETTERNAVSYYDWEMEQNESRRNIRVIKKEYYSQIIEELDELTNNSRNSSIVRRLV